jgi:hypothetical protein
MLLSLIDKSLAKSAIWEKSHLFGSGSDFSKTRNSL